MPVPGWITLTDFRHRRRPAHGAARRDKCGGGCSLQRQIEERPVAEDAQAEGLVRV